jgi:hypothetical protein
MALEMLVYPPFIHFMQLLAQEYFNQVGLIICMTLPRRINVPYILESNPHSGFGDFLNEKKLVRDSKPHLSFNNPLPMGRLIE